MASTFRLEVVTPDRKFFEDYVEMVVLKTIDGEIGILKGHVPLVTPLAIGIMKIKKDGEWKKAFLSSGFVEVKRDKVVVIADAAEWPEEIDAERARRAKERAEKRLEKKEEGIDVLRAEAALKRALTRLKLIEEYQKYTK